MRILFDHGTPRGLARALEGHTVEEAKDLGWDTLTNGELLSAADNAGFNVLLTTDQNLPHQQNLTGRKIGVVVLGSARWRLIAPVAAQIVAAVNAVKSGTCVVVNIPNA
jgi:predicted nuclease of predicted toxin-antitoxin system